MNIHVSHVLATLIAVSVSQLHLEDDVRQNAGLVLRYVESPEAVIPAECVHEFIAVAMLEQNYDLASKLLHDAFPEKDDVFETAMLSLLFNAALANDSVAIRWVKEQNAIAGWYDSDDMAVSLAAIAGHYALVLQLINDESDPQDRASLALTAIAPFVRRDEDLRAKKLFDIARAVVADEDFYEMKEGVVSRQAKMSSKTRHLEEIGIRVDWIPFLSLRTRHSIVNLQPKPELAAKPSAPEHRVATFARAVRSARLADASGSPKPQEALDETLVEFSREARFSGELAYLALLSGNTAYVNECLEAAVNSEPEPFALIAAATLLRQGAALRTYFDARNSRLSTKSLEVYLDFSRKVDKIEPIGFRSELVRNRIAALRYIGNATGRWKKDGL